MISIKEEFSINLRNIDLSKMLMAKNWDDLKIKHPEFSEIEEQIKHWLEKNAPLFYGLTVEASGRKNRLNPLLNAIKCKILFEQLNYVGLKNSELQRLKMYMFNLVNDLQPFVEKKYKDKKLNEAVLNSVEFNSQDLNYVEYSVWKLFRYHGIDKKILSWVTEIALPLQPDNKYLNDMLIINQEIQFLINAISDGIEELDFSPKDQSDYHRCACCFRFIRLKPNDRDCIAYHGYKMHQYGVDIVNDSCSGAKFPPLEKSSEGTISQLQIERNSKRQYEKVLLELNEQFKDIENQINELTPDCIAMTEKLEIKKMISKKINQSEGAIRQSNNYAEVAFKMLNKYHPNEVKSAKNLFLTES